MTLCISPISQTQLEATAALHELIFAEIGATAASFRAVAERAGTEVWVAIENDRVIGYSVLWKGPKYFYWNWLGVLPDFQKKGAGTALMKKVLERAASEGCQTIELDSRNRFVDALRFYLKFGFQIVGTYLHDDGELMIKMKWRLSSG